MAKANQEKPLLATKLPKVTRLNRNTILILSGLVLLIVIGIFISALSNTAPSSNLPTANVKPSSSVVKANLNPLKDLPGSYTDAQQIDNLLNRNQPPKIVNQIPPELQSEISNLTAQQSQLQAQLVTLKAEKNAPPPVVEPDYSGADQQAMTSSIFIAGGAPAPLPQETQAQLDKDKQAADNKINNMGYQSPYDQQNNQSQKSGFLDSKPDTSIYNPNQLQSPISPYLLQSGNVIPAILETEIVSNLPGLITAVVRRDVYDSVTGQYLLVPKGSRLIGEYNSTISYGQTQLQAVFTRLVRPDGTSVVLPGKTSGVNSMGVSGLSDQVDNHWGGVIGSAALMTLFSLPAALAQNSQNQSPVYVNGDQVVGGGYGMNNTAQSSALQALSQATTQIGSTIAQREMNVQPTITINAGYVFSIMVTKDILMPPYQTPMESIPEISGS